MHAFPIKQTDAFASRWDCPPEEKQFVQDAAGRPDVQHQPRLDVEHRRFSNA
jgi:hypothetical protein